MMAMSCPLCCQSISVDLLRTNLISIINRPLICPICGDVQRSLDNLAAHLTHHIQVPSQIGHQTEQPHDVSNVIHNININNRMTTMTTTTSTDERVANHSDLELEQRNCDGNMTRKLDAPSKSLASSPLSLHQLELNDQPRITTTSPIIATVDQMDQPFLCNLCECSFRSQDLQQMHMQLVHEIHIRPSYEDTKFVNARAISASMLQCYMCPKRFKMIGSLRLHVRMVHGVSHVPQKMRCTPNALIGETTTTTTTTAATAANNLAMVMAATGNEEEMETSDLIASTSPLHVNSGNRPLIHNNQSDYYNNYSLDDTTFGTANSNSNSNSSSVSGGVGGEVDLEQNNFDGPNNGNNNSKEMSITNTEDRVHKCDICNKRFTTKYFLKKHKRLHTGEMPYTCELCHRTFTFQQSYHRHLSYHTNDRPHSCSICGRAFKELSTLHNHQRIHSGEKPFECETCGKCFRQRVSYLVHRRIHTGVMPYNCVTCDKKFRYKISLRTHKCTGFIGNECTSATITTTITTATTKAASATAPVTTTSTTTVNNDAVAFIDNDQQSMASCQQSLDELITESCNRMGIVDRTDSNPNQNSISPESSSSVSAYTNSNAQNGQHSNALQFECDSFNLNDLTFCTGEITNTDLANVVPSMNEIFPQSIEILNALYDNASANNSDLHHFYDSSPSQQ